MIHSTALIDPAARLGVGVRIGPYVTIEGPVEIGDGCVFEAHAALVGDVRMGKDNRVGHGAVIGGWPQDVSYRPEATRSGVVIGERNTIREHCTIHRGATNDSVTALGDGNLLMAGAHMGHNAAVGDDCIVANNVLLGGYVEVGDRAFLGGGSVFHQHTRVGRGVIVQGASGFSKDVPPFTIGAEVNFVAGLNVVGLRRAGFSAEERLDLKRAFSLLYTSGLNVTQALEQSRAQAWPSKIAREFWEFVSAAGKRGICALMKSSKQS